ncbi:MAG: hypothetical protein HXX09_06710 [Bacteroidetes bacterium]|nr:hypothetical protein [Bacteroidota bacterium]
MKKAIFISIFVFLSVQFEINAQNFGLGPSIIYNFQTESFGIGLRGNIFPNKRVSIVPQLSYYPAFNKVTEFIGGVGVEVKVIKKQKFNIYGLVHGAYDNWINAEASPMAGAKPNNWNLEGGIGITNNKCFRPFLEYRYNIKFMETHLDLGFIYIFGCKQKSGYKNRNSNKCPAYS